MRKEKYFELVVIKKGCRILQQPYDCIKVQFLIQCHKLIFPRAKP